MSHEYVNEVLKTAAPIASAKPGAVKKLLGLLTGRTKKRAGKLLSKAEKRRVDLTTKIRSMGGNRRTPFTESEFKRFNFLTERGKNLGKRLKDIEKALYRASLDQAAARGGVAAGSIGVPAAAYLASKKKSKK